MKPRVRKVATGQYEVKFGNTHVASIEKLCRGAYAGKWCVTFRDGTSENHGSFAKARSCALAAVITA